MFDSRFNIDQVGNIRDGAIACSIAHLIVSGDEVPPIVNRELGPMPLRLARPHVGGVAPGVCVWRDDDLRVIAIAGAREPADQARAIAGWSAPTTISGLDGRFNGSTVNWFQSVLAYVTAELAADSVPTWIFGFSFGGGAAAVLAKWLQLIPATRRTWSISFGSPRFCDHQATAQFEGSNAARIFVRDDPIAILPPTFTQAPFMHAALGVLVSLDWAQWRFTGRGYALHGDGRLTPQMEPDSIGYPIDLNIYEYIRQSSGEGRPHSIINYRTILELAYPNESDRATDPDVDLREVGGHSLPMEPRGEPPAKRARAREIRSVIHDRERTVASNVAAGERRLNRRLIRIYRETSGYSVFVDQTRVYSATSKRDARGVANALRAVAIQVGQQPDLWTRDDIVTIIREAQAQ